MGNGGFVLHSSENVHIITQKKLKVFWAKHADAEAALAVWYLTARKADWNSFGDVQKVLGTARSIHGNRVVFKIKGNRYRLIVKMEYRKKRIYIRFVGTHAEYDRINAETV